MALTEYLQIKHIEIPKWEYQKKLISKYGKNILLPTIEKCDTEIALLKEKLNQYKHESVNY